METIKTTLTRTTLRWQAPSVLGRLDPPQKNSAGSIQSNLICQTQICHWHRSNLGNWERHGSWSHGQKVTRQAMPWMPGEDINKENREENGFGSNKFPLLHCSIPLNFAPNQAATYHAFNNRWWRLLDSKSSPVHWCTTRAVNATASLPCGVLALSVPYADENSLMLMRIPSNLRFHNFKTALYRPKCIMTPWFTEFEVGILEWKHSDKNPSTHVDLQWLMSRVTNWKFIVSPNHFYSFHLASWLFLACVGPVAGSYSDVCREEKGILGDRAHWTSPNR